MSYRILVINWQDIRNPLSGGAEVHLHEIFKRVARRGHHITLLCCGHQELPGEEVIDNIQVIRRGNRNIFNYLVPFLYHNLSRQTKYDVVIDDINKIPFYSPLYVKQPLIGIVHHLFGSSIFIESTLPVALYVSLAEKLIPSIYRNIPLAVVSNSTKNELIRKGIPEQNIHLIPNAVDQSAYQVIPDKKSSTPLVGYLGRVKKYKSIDHLIMAFAEVHRQIPQAKLLIVGDGDYLVDLKKLVSRLQLSQVVTFAGAAFQKQKVDFLNQMWFMVNPSPKEGWGLTVIEANACGVPVIAADSPGLRDSVVAGETGLFYSYGDYHRLAELIIQLIEQPKLRNSLAQKSIEWARQFNWDDSATKMLTLIENVLSRRKTNVQ